jgi:tRNA dimethylallyltransferase
VPIVCGGTHYYTQHMLFPPSQLSIDRQRERDTQSSLRWTPPCPLPAVPNDFDPAMKRYLETFYLPEPTYPPSVTPVPGTSKSGTSQSSRPTLTDPAELLALHRLLTAVDPVEAKRWHWRDGRKVRRAIERWWEAAGSQAASCETARPNSSDGKETRLSR